MYYYIFYMFNAGKMHTHKDNTPQKGRERTNFFIFYLISLYKYFRTKCTKAEIKIVINNKIEKFGYFSRPHQFLIILNHAFIEWRRHIDEQ